jgi:hypothetical protein
MRVIIWLVRVVVIVRWFIQVFERMIMFAFSVVCVNYTFSIVKLEVAIPFVDMFFKSPIEV